jgi:hypothetical protein
LLLPQMDAGNMKIDYRNPRKGGGSNGPALQTVISSYVCPSANHSGAGIAYGDYRCNMGTTHNNGVMFLDSTVSDRLIKDGAATTLLFGESPFGLWGDSLSCCARIPIPSEVAAGRTAFDWVTSSPQSAGCGSVQGGCLDVVTTAPLTGETSYLIFGFGSHHPDIAIFAMADGSARPIKKSTDVAIVQSLATRDGGERIGDDF